MGGSVLDLQQAGGGSALYAAGLLGAGAQHLGGTALLGLAAGDALEERILKLGEESNKSVSYDVTVSFDLKNQTAAPVGSNHLCRAELCWGSIKGSGRCVIDIKHGTRVTLECTVLVVDVLYRNPVGVAPVGPSVLVRASIGLGSVGANRLTLTEFTQLIAPAVPGAVIPISSYAREVEVKTDQDPFAPIARGFTISFFTDSGGTGVAQSVSTGRDTLVRIPNGVESMVIINDPIAPAMFTPIFHLEL